MSAFSVHALVAVAITMYLLMSIAYYIFLLLLVCTSLLFSCTSHLAACLLPFELMAEAWLLHSCAHAGRLLCSHALVKQTSYVLLDIDNRIGST